MSHFELALIPISKLCGVVPALSEFALLLGTSPRSHYLKYWGQGYRIWPVVHSLVENPQSPGTYYLVGPLADAPILEALRKAGAEVHVVGVIFRDLSPENTTQTAVATYRNAFGWATNVKQGSLARHVSAYLKACRQVGAANPSDTEIQIAFGVSRRTIQRAQKNVLGVRRKSRRRPRRKMR